MKTYNFLKSESIPDYVNERDVFGLVKSKRTSMIKRFKFKPLNAPVLDVDYAGLGARTLATFFDIIIIASLMLIPEIYFFSFNFSNIDYNSFRFLVGITIWIFYHAAFDSSAMQATFGKRLLKLKIIDLNGTRISFVRALFRCLAMFISIAPIGLGIWYISTDSKKQGWHDLIAGSYVIKS
jgi:uncharacterized RDD family membrane protein YckC